MKFEKINWKSAYEWLGQKQEMLLKAYKKGEIEAIRRVQCAILKDFRTTAIAVRRISENQGSSTPGIDGRVVKTIKERNELVQQTYKIMCNPSKYKASLTRCILISKPDGTKRTFAIPTTLDRAIQFVYLEAIDPIVEEQSCLDSYGFRKFRSAENSVLALRSKLIHPKASEWVLRVDIKKCFEKISHDFLLRHIPVHRKVDRNIMMKMLKAKIRLYNLDSIKAPGNPTLPKGLNAYCSTEKVKLQKQKPNMFFSSTLERIVTQQKHTCPACGQSLINGEYLELHHSPSIQKLRLVSILPKNATLIALHRLCHQQLHTKQPDI